MPLKDQLNYKHDIGKGVSPALQVCYCQPQAGYF